LKITHNAESTTVWNLKPERWGVIAGSREVPGRKGMWQETTTNNNNNNNNNNLYSSKNIVRVTKLRRMGWAGPVARLGRGEVYRSVGRTVKGRLHDPLPL
jgi:hypothetical protein